MKKEKNEPDRDLWLDIFIKLEQYIAGKKSLKISYRKIIEFSFDIYSSIVKLDSSNEEKSKMVALMVKSMEIGSNE